MLFLYYLLPLLPLLHRTLATPNPAPSIMKRDDCNGSLLCPTSSHADTTALDTYNSSANAHTYYNDYTSYTANQFTAIYICPEGKYPSNVTGAQIYEAGALVAQNCGRTCGTRWLYDSDNKLKCRVTLNRCTRCKNVVNGRDGEGSGSPTPVTSTAGAAGTPRTEALDEYQGSLHA
ncbi:hypothetical protein MMC17_001715 [Xylographa soralifera]|nr:hypothetical protein [Xylographa soralifera]